MLIFKHIKHKVAVVHKSDAIYNNNNNNNNNTFLNYVLKQSHYVNIFI